ncbi:MAG: hypothetical protein CMH97_03260 [Oceanospirillaceae bacterium]|uniref:DUF3301 domain-containing protein n=1 Tax=unclassified Thalassolituus TaxID=2624967 RepID=UPI000C0CCB8A|nr:MULTISPECIES: DUF3301 domain-containing protein [unclassified Thalassolituus]MAE34270.1 hypothetical protein [Oceanospirillaceae bacterium]MBN57594.1 hypothetical protein [Oceanospirillaceae bacterium]MDQ4423033.1 DUF3301 domain-containing protein [Thalassolituus sp.]MDQ4424876.1 DUF3301 domain-containing protein [Thalassolituus sp.]
MELLVIAAIAGLGLLGWPAIQRQQAARVLALRYLRKQCQQENLQLLDDTVSLAHMRIKFVKGRPVLIRGYEFEFSVDGGNRYPGSVVLEGYRPVSLVLAVHSNPEA